MIPALIIFDAVFDFSFIIKVIAMKPFPLIFWLNSEYFEYNRFTNKIMKKKVQDFKKRIFLHFSANPNRARTRFVCQLFFYFNFCKCYVNTKRIPLEQTTSTRVNQP